MEAQRRGRMRLRSSFDDLAECLELAQLDLLYLQVGGVQDGDTGEAGEMAPDLVRIDEQSLADNILARCQCLQMPSEASVKNKYSRSGLQLPDIMSL
jgi:hypothetical protein